MRLISEYLGGLKDISRAEISGLLNAYGGGIEEDSINYLIFSSPQPEKIISRSTFSKRIGRIIDDPEAIEIDTNKRYALREKRKEGRNSLIGEIARKIKGKVDLTNPDVTFFIYNVDSPIISEVLYERRLAQLIDPRYSTRPTNHPSSISPLLARGMINIAGIKDEEKFIDPFAGTGTYLIEGFRMGIWGEGIDRNWKMVEGGNLNLRHFNFPETIKHGDFSELSSVKGASAIVTDPPYGRGARIFSQSRDSLYSKFFSILSGFVGNKVFCLPSEELFVLAQQYLEVELICKIRVHSSLTRYISKAH
jgi:tRNA (guanine10-N2)-dimethyltransferase